MATSPSEEHRLEIAHVLFIDTVGYSKLSTGDQHSLLRALNHLVREAPTFRAAEAAQALIRLPTGDGMVLVFYDQPQSPILCATEIALALRERPVPNLHLRMGIHSGPVTRLEDVNNHANVAGAGVNVSQRIMSCADAGHILLSKRAAEDLAEDDRWRPYLHELGFCETKHGVKLQLVNYFTETIGNKELPKKLQPSVDLGAASRPARTRQHLLLAGTGLLILTLFLALGFLLSYLRHSETSQDAATQLVAKRISVLPFQNQSEDKDMGPFAEGLEVEIHHKLSVISELEVISRDSVHSYKSNQHYDPPAIARALGSGYIVEGTIRRDQGDLYIALELVNAVTGIDAGSYRYPVKKGLFGIGSEVAEQIARKLNARLSSREKDALAQPPTSSLTAFDLYTRATTLGLASTYDPDRQKKLSTAVQLLDEAVSIDPKYLLAYCQLAHTHDLIYFMSIDHTSARLSFAQTAIDHALQLSQNSRPARLALAYHLYCKLDYDRASAELASITAEYPNDAFAWEIAGYIQRRQGDFKKSIASMQRALQLDPRNVHLLQELAWSYETLRQYPEMAQMLDRFLELVPHDPEMRVHRAFIALEATADTKPVHAAIQEVLAEDSQAASKLALVWFYVAMCEHDDYAAEQALAALPAGGYREQILAFPDSWCTGLIARLRGDSAAATAAFSKARSEMEKRVTRQPDFAANLCVLGAIDAALGRKEDAIREGRRAVELLPVKKDAINGELMLEYLALIYAWTGESDQAVEQLAAAAKLPGQLTYGDLCLNPIWEPLRNHPGFKAIVASLAPP